MIESRKKFGISVAGQFPAAYRTAEALEAAKLDFTLFTAHPRFALPEYAIDPSHIRNSGWINVAARAVSKIPGFDLRKIDRWRLAVADSFAGRALAGADVFNGWTNYSLKTGIAVKRRGGRYVLQSGSAHHRFQDQVLSREAERLGISHVSQDGVLAEKTDREIEIADCIVVPSTFALESFVGRGIDRKRLRLVPEGVDVGAIMPGKKEDGKFRIIYLGNISVRKGVVCLLEAIRHLGNREIEVWLRGTIEPQLQPIVDRFRDLFELKPRVDRSLLGQFLSQASVVVVPSIEDGWCATTVEALAAGVPVIVSGNTGTADVVRAGKCGAVVPAGDSLALAAEIDRFWAARTDLADLKVAARSASLGVTWANYRERIRDTLVEVSNFPASAPIELQGSVSK